MRSLTQLVGAMVLLRSVLPLRSKPLLSFLHLDLRRRLLTRLQDSAKMNIYTLSQEELVSVLGSWQQPGFRAKQIREWVYDKGVLGEEALPMIRSRFYSARFSSDGQPPSEFEAAASRRLLLWCSATRTGAGIERRHLEASLRPSRRAAHRVCPHAVSISPLPPIPAPRSSLQFFQV